jgi:hypothetical protein
VWEYKCGGKCAGEWVCRRKDCVEKMVGIRFCTHENKWKMTKCWPVQKIGCAQHEGMVL